MKVSIITPTFNSEETLAHCLESCHKQTYSDIEHLIIDAGSNDATLPLVKEYSHVAQVISEGDDGIYDALNKGIKLASGDIIGVLHSDDEFSDSDVIQKVAGIFSSPEVDVVYGDLVYVDRIDKRQVRRVWRSGPFHRNRFLRGWMPPHPTFFARKELFERWGKYNIELTTSADYELMLRFLYKHHANAVYLPEIMVKMRMGGQSNKSVKNRLVAHLEDRQAWRVNGLKPPIYTVFLKPLSKVHQFLRRKH